MLNTYDTIYDLYSNTVIAIIVAVAPAVAVGAHMKTSATIFITHLRSHIIDHGSLLYLTQQILLYNQQYVYDDGNNDSVSSANVTYAVTMSSVTVTYAVTIRTNADEAQYDYYYCDTAVSITSPSTVTVGDTDNMTSAVSIASPSICIDTESSIVIDIESSSVASSYNNNNGGIDKHMYDFNVTSSADNNVVSSADVTIMTTTVPVTYEVTASAVRATTSNELPSAIHDDIFSAVADAVTRMRCLPTILIPHPLLFMMEILLLGTILLLLS